LNRARIHLRKRKAPSQEVNLQQLAQQIWNLSVRLPDQCKLSEKNDHSVRTASCEAVWSNKFRNKIHGWFRSYFQVTTLKFGSLSFGH